MHYGYVHAHVKGTVYILDLSYSHRKSMEAKSIDKSININYLMSKRSISGLLSRFFYNPFSVLGTCVLYM